MMERSREEWRRRILEEFAAYEDLQRVAERVHREAVERIIAEVLSAHASSHLAAYEKFGESNLASILFLDLVGYSKLKRDDDQREAIELLNRLVLNALSATGCRLDDVVCLPTGDGMGLCFSSVTDGPLMVAEEVQVALAEENKKRKRQKIQVRMGIHCGNVLRVTDMKGSYNLAGAAINIAQRAMNCGDDGHIFCTREAYREFIKMKDYKRVLKPIQRPFTVKHGVRLKLYNYVRPDRGVGNPTVPHQEP
jgi:class 3 adenylate cyclase